MVRLLIYLLELVVHVLFLAKVLGHSNAADHLLHVGVDPGERSLRPPGSTPRNPPEAQGNANDDGGNGQCQQGKTHIDVEQDGCNEKEKQKLAQKVERERDNRSKLLGIGCHPANNLSAWIFIIEGHITSDNGCKGILLQVQYHIAYRTCGVALA